MTTFAATKHCELRMSQRGISSMLIDLVIEFGETSFHNGGEVTSVPKSKLEKLRKDALFSNQLIDKLKKIYIVEKDGYVVTTAKRFKRFKRDA